MTDWRPDDPVFWKARGRRIARRNLWISIAALVLAFAVWMVWSVLVAWLPRVGFGYSTDQLFWLAALPGLSGATLRIAYSFVVPIVGGRRWTTLSTASLLVPAVGMGLAVRNPDTPYWVLAILALLSGLGGANFASSMANISYFFPKAEKGHALALNGGLGNLGVSLTQFLVPLVVAVPIFGALSGGAQRVEDGAPVWLQNAGFVWAPLIVVATAAAWLGMNDIAGMKASFRDQAVVIRRKHTWIMCVLYTGTFGSFIGFSAGFPLLATSQFPEANVLPFVFLGPLIGAVSRAATGWISDRFGGGRVTMAVFMAMIALVIAALFFLDRGIYAGFFATFVLLFFVTGVGNASTFQMIPAIARTDVGRRMPEGDEHRRLRQSEREAGAVIGLVSAVAAYGAFLVPRAYGTSIAWTGAAQAALVAFLAFYVICLATTWWFYVRERAEVPC